MRCHPSDGGAWTSFSWLMTSSYIHRPLHEGIRNRPLDFINQEGVQHYLSDGAHQKEGWVVRGEYFCPHISDASGVLAHIHLWTTWWEHCSLFTFVMSLFSKESSHHFNALISIEVTYANLDLWCSLAWSKQVNRPSVLFMLVCMSRMSAINYSSTRYSLRCKVR